LENPDAIGDLYLDIAEAYMTVGLYTSAKPILISLVMSANYSMVCGAVYYKKTKQFRFILLTARYL